jgi:hypothetical protein
MMACIKTYRGLLFLLFAIVIGACSSQGTFSHLDESSRFVLRSDSGLFRGVYSDMGASEVKAHEKATLAEEESDYLRYTHEGQPLDGQAEYEYFFASQDRLDRIVATVTIYNKDNLEQLKQDIVTFYDQKFGNHKTKDEEKHLWEFDAPKGRDGSIEIELTTASDKDAYTLNIVITKYYKYLEPGLRFLF